MSLQAQREDGAYGFVPENYVQNVDVATNGALPDENEVNVDHDTPPSDSYNAVTQPPNERASSYSATDYEVQQTMVAEEEQQQQVAPPPELQLNDQETPVEQPAPGTPLGLYKTSSHITDSLAVSYINYHNYVSISYQDSFFPGGYRRVFSSELLLKNEDPLQKMLNSPADGTSVSLPLGCESVVRPLVEDLFSNLANGPGRFPLHECHLLDFSTFLEVGPHS